MLLEGSCHCGCVRFKLHAPHPYPYNQCYCTICRKTAGGGGYAINLGGEFGSLDVVGQEHISVYQAKIPDAGSGETSLSPAKRHFCSRCGSALWLWDPRWPDLVHPFASAIDTPLPSPPERSHMMLNYKAPWVELRKGPADLEFQEYPNESLAEWHERHGLADPRAE